MDNDPEGTGPDDDPIERTRKRLGESIERNIDRASKTAVHLDQTLISLSAGALVFSMTFVGALAPAKHLLVVLFSSWIGFASSIVSLIFAIRAEQSALITAIKNAGQARECLDTDPSIGVFAMIGLQPVSTLKVTESRVVAWLNNLALTAFILGVVLLGVFVGYNLWLTKP